MHGHQKVKPMFNTSATVYRSNTILNEYNQLTIWNPERIIPRADIASALGNVKEGNMIMC